VGWHPVASRREKWEITNQIGEELVVFPDPVEGVGEDTEALLHVPSPGSQVNVNASVREVFLLLL